VPPNGSSIRTRPAIRTIITAKIKTLGMILETSLPLSSREFARIDLDLINPPEWGAQSQWIRLRKLALNWMLALARR
jgi:hypothetical protein